MIIMVYALLHKAFPCHQILRIVWSLLYNSSHKTETLQNSLRGKQLIRQAYANLFSFVLFKQIYLAHSLSFAFYPTLSLIGFIRVL